VRVAGGSPSAPGPSTAMPGADPKACGADHPAPRAADVSP
jgi:hypothetical protein